MNIDESWIDALNTGTGLAGFALFLTFTVLAKMANRKQKNMVFYVCVVFAFISIVGGLMVSFEADEEGDDVGIKVSQTVIGCDNKTISTASDNNKK